MEIREHPIVLGGARGSRVTFTGDRVRMDGADATLQDVHEERGARVQDGKLRLRGRWDGLFLRVTEGARARGLQLRVVGQGSGVLYVGERSFWSPAVRWTTYPDQRAFPREPHVRRHHLGRARHRGHAGPRGGRGGHRVGGAGAARANRRT